MKRPLIGSKTTNRNVLRLDCNEIIVIIDEVISVKHTDVHQIVSISLAQQTLSYKQLNICYTVKHKSEFMLRVGCLKVFILLFFLSGRRF